MDRKIGFIGSGNMASAIVGGLSTTNSSSNTYVSDINISKAEALQKNFGINVLANNAEIMKQCDVIVLAVKPNVFKDILLEIKTEVKERHLLVSLAAGISINAIEENIGKPVKVVRTMPNTPVCVGQGMIAVSHNSIVEKEDLEFVVNMFSRIGCVDIIDEGLMDIIPAVSGSSPAYVYMFIEALADGAVLQGMARNKAYKYAAQAVLGAAKMVLEVKKHPGELKDMVCSPSGTTIEALYSLEKSGFRGAVIEAMNACTAKAMELTRKNDNSNGKHNEASNIINFKVSD